MPIRTNHSSWFCHVISGLSLIIVFACCISRLCADTAIETETAQLGDQGELTFSSSFQFEKDKDGKTVFSLTQFEYAITDRAEILVEPFFQEWGFPNEGGSFHGVGDLEITPSYMVHLEEPEIPAIVLAFKVKVPTATNPDIGTGEYDYYPFVIIGKHIGEYTWNANFGYNFITSPPGEKLNNQFIYDLEVERPVAKQWKLVAEVFGNTSPASGQNGTFAGSTAVEYEFMNDFYAFITLGYDTDQLVNSRLGVTLSLF